MTGQLEVPTTHKQKAKFWDKVYHITLLVLVVFGVAMACLGVRQAYIATAKVDRVLDRVDKTTKDTQSQIQCIGEYFTRDNRANLRIDSLDVCNIQDTSKPQANTPQPTNTNPKTSNITTTGGSVSQSTPPLASTQNPPPTPQPNPVAQILTRIDATIVELIKVTGGK